MRDLAALQLRSEVAAPSQSAPQRAGERLDWSEEVATTWGGEGGVGWGGGGFPFVGKLVHINEYRLLAGM